MADKIVTDKGTISLDIVDEIIKSNELRSSGEDYGYYYDRKTKRLEIGDVNAVTTNMYSGLNEGIQQGGVDTTEELKGLAGKATGIDVPPSGDIPIVTDLTGIRMPSKEKMASNVTSFLTKLGVPMDNSMFVGELLTDVNQSGMGILDATGIGELSELAEGFTKFQSGLASDDPKLALGGLAQTTLGAVGAYPFFKTLFDKASPKAKEALSGLATKAREYKGNQTPGTKLLSTDPTDPAVDAIIKLDEMVNRPFYKTPPNTPERAEEIRKLREEANQNKFGTPTPNEPNIVAFHGSGADFDEFKVEKIGTGEGNQAFGYGLYFTESKDIAKFYKSSVGAGNEVTYKGKTVRDLDKDNASYEENIAHMVGQQNNAKDRQRVFDNERSSNMNSLSGIEQAIKDFNTDPVTYPLKFRGLSLTMDDALRIKNDFAERVSALNELEKNLDTIKTKPRGKLYKVGIAPKESELLDYDAPIGEQNEFIKTRLKKLVEEINLDDAMNLGFDPFTIGEAQALQKAKENMLDPQRSVVSFLNDWAVFRGEQSTAEKLLDKYGIKGIRYKANQGVGARNVPETGKNNYVIFDDNLIKVMAKYGIVGPVALTAVASQKEGDDG